MSQSLPTLKRTCLAGADLSAKKYYIVKLDSAGAVVLAAAATDAIVGVLQNKPQSGEAAVYAFGGTTKVILGGTVAVGAWVTSDGNGKGVATTTDGDVTIGRYIGTAAGASGDIAEVQMSIQHLYIA